MHPLKLFFTYFRALPDAIRFGKELGNLGKIEKEIHIEHFKRAKENSRKRYYESTRNDYKKIYYKTLASDAGKKALVRLLGHYQKHQLIQLEGKEPGEVAEKIVDDDEFHERLVEIIKDRITGEKIEAVPNGLHDAMHPAGIFAFHDDFRDALFEAVARAKQT